MTALTPKGEATLVTVEFTLSNQDDVVVTDGDGDFALD